MGLGKANYCQSALVEKGLVKLDNFRKKQNKTPIRLSAHPRRNGRKTRIIQAFLRRKEAEFEAIQREIEALESELESSVTECQSDIQTKNASLGTMP